MKKLLFVLIILLFAFPLYAQDSEVQDLTDITTPAAGDDMYIVDDPDVTPISRKINIGNLLGVATDLEAGGALSANTVDSSELVDGGVDLSHMSSASVDSDNIVDNTIVNADVNSAAAISMSKTAFIAGTLATLNTNTLDVAVATADISDVSVTQTEFSQLETLAATTISAAQWTGLGGATAAGLALWDDANNVAQLITLGLTATASEINTPLDGALVILTEFRELETIGTTTLSAGQWAGLGGATAAGLALWDDVDNIAQLVTLGLTATASEINTPLDGASVTLAEFQQLEAIGATTISANQWTAIGGMAETLTFTELDLLDGRTGILVTDATECTDLEGAGLSIVAGQLVASAGAPEGTAVLSTGEVGGNKFLREDGDGTCSWQAAVATHDGTVTWTGTSILESGVAFQFGDASDATLTHTYANTGTNVDVAYSTAAMAVTGALTATNLSGTNTGDETVAVDIVTTAPLTVNAGANLDNVIIGADADITFAVSAASATAAGVSELLIASEIDTGTDSTRVMPVDQFVASKRNIRWLVFSLVEAATDCATATNIAGDFVSPIAGTILQSDTTPFYLYATNSTAGTTGTMTVDISIGGTTIMTTNKLDFDTTEKTTTTAATPPDLTTTALAVGDIITIDIDAIHTTAAKGLTVYMAVRE